LQEEFGKEDVRAGDDCGKAEYELLRVTDIGSPKCCLYNGAGVVGAW